MIIYQSFHEPHSVSFGVHGDILIYRRQLSHPTGWALSLVTILNLIATIMIDIK